MKDLNIYLGYFFKDPFFISAVVVLIISLFIGINRYLIKKNNGEISDGEILVIILCLLSSFLLLILFAHCRALIETQNKMNEVWYEQSKVDNTGTVIGKEIQDNDDVNKYYIYVSSKNQDKSSDTLKISVDTDIYYSVDIGSVVNLNAILNIPGNTY